MIPIAITSTPDNIFPMPTDHHNQHQIFAQPLSISQADREKLNGHGAKVIWLTGLSGSGKSTLADALEVQLHAQHKHTYLLDGDNVRKNLNRDLGFSAESRSENIRRIAEVAQMMKEAGLIVIVTCISPFNQDREAAKQLIGANAFIEIYISTPLHVCEQRDPKGLYKKSRAGLIAQMTGIDSPYEAPINPSLALDTSNTSVQDGVNQILALLA